MPLGDGPKLREPQPHRLQRGLRAIFLLRFIAASSGNNVDYGGSAIFKRRSWDGHMTMLILPSTPWLMGSPVLLHLACLLLFGSITIFAFSATNAGLSPVILALAMVFAPVDLAGQSVFASFWQRGTGVLYVLAHNRRCEAGDNKVSDCGPLLPDGDCAGYGQ